MDRPIVVALEDSHFDINLCGVTGLDRRSFTTDGSAGLRVYLAGGDRMDVTTPHDQAKFLAAWGMFRASVADTDTETRRAEFTAIRERIVHAGTAIKARKTPELFAILEDLTGALVRLVDVVEGEAR